jgi:hypothetical protein
MAEKSRGSYYPSHFKNVVNFFPITKSSLRVGMVCKLNYKAKYREGKKTSLYLIISLYEGYIHAIDLDYIEPSKLKLLLNLCENKKAETLSFSKSVAYRFPFKSSGVELYQQIISYFGEGSYRVLKPSKLFSISVCNLQLLVESLKTKEVKKDTIKKELDKDKKVNNKSNDIKNSDDEEQKK